METRCHDELHCRCAVDYGRARIGDFRRVANPSFYERKSVWRLPGGAVRTVLQATRSFFRSRMFAYHAQRRESGLPREMTRRRDSPVELFGIGSNRAADQVGLALCTSQAGITSVVRKHLDPCRDLAALPFAFRRTGRDSDNHTPAPAIRGKAC